MARREGDWVKDEGAGFLGGGEEEGREEERAGAHLSCTECVFES